MAWSDPTGDLRVFLSDGPYDNFIKQKKVLGETDGVNRTYYTFDDRILASGNQSVAGSPLRVFWGPQEIAASGILVTDQVRGEFQMMFVASGGVRANEKLTSSYHYQQHLDSELNMYLQQGLNFCSATTAAQVPAELQAAVLAFAGYNAHTKLAQRWQQRKSEQFMLQDAPMRQEAEDRVRYHQEEAQRLYAQAREMRQDYYDTRNSRAFAPAYGLLSRIPNPYTPKR